MQKKTHISLGFLIFGVLPLPIQAEDCCLPLETGSQCCYPSIMGKRPIEDCEHICEGYSQYAGPELSCGWDIFLSGDFIYWTISKGLNQTAILNLNNANNNKETLTWDYDYRPGFKIGLGTHLSCYDDWTLLAEYTWYHHTFHQKFSTKGNETLTGGFFFPALLYSSLGLFFSSMDFEDTFKYNEIDLFVGRPFYFGRKLILNTYAGFISTIYNVSTVQRYVETAGFLGNPISGLPYTQTGKEHIWTIGFADRANFSFLLGNGFSLLGKAQVGLLYYRYTQYQQAVNQSGQPLLISKLDKHGSAIDAYASGGLGFAWGSYFCCNRYHIDLEATYDFIKMPKHESPNVLFITETIMQGLTMHAKFDF